jgi:hypothetical protein
MDTGPRFRKLTVIADFTWSVGWLGDDAAFVALALNSETLRIPSSCVVPIGMASLGWFVLIPSLVVWD